MWDDDSDPLFVIFRSTDDSDFLYALLRRDRLMIPIRSVTGEVIGFGGRALSDEYSASTGGGTHGPASAVAGGSGSSASVSKAKGCVCRLPDPLFAVVWGAPSRSYDCKPAGLSLVTQ